MLGGRGTGEMNRGWLDMGTEDQASGERILRRFFLVGAHVSGHGSRESRRGSKVDNAEGVEIAPSSSGSSATRGVAMCSRMSWAMRLPTLT